MEQKEQRVRFYRVGYIVGFEALKEGLGLIFQDGSRELLSMSVEEAEDNADFLLEHLEGEPNGLIGITWTVL